MINPDERPNFERSPASTGINRRFPFQPTYSLPGPPSYSAQNHLAIHPSLSNEVPFRRGCSETSRFPSWPPKADCGCLHTDRKSASWSKHKLQDQPPNARIQTSANVRSPPPKLLQCNLLPNQRGNSLRSSRSTLSGISRFAIPPVPFPCPPKLAPFGRSSARQAGHL